jgi:AraC-like DNA-binding protein
MKEVHHFATISEYNQLAGQETFHPLVSVIDFSTLNIPDAEGRRELLRQFSLGFYAVFLKNGNYCNIHYGRNNYDYQEGTLVFIAPEQVVKIEYTADGPPSGYALLFHPDLVRGTALGNIMKDYSFFSYSAHEALHLSEREKQIVVECFQKIDFELQQAIDKHSKRLIVSNIELFLNYCVRFYDRQFITREIPNSSVLERFEQLLTEYFQSEKPLETGLPGVSHFADQLHLSANYFGDLVKKETGKAAQEYIHAKLIDVAKEKMFDHRKSVSEIAYELGFKYPQHFTRFFKQHVGATPNDYRGSMN